MGYPACDNGAGLGGGDDTIAAGEVENVIGTAFPDIIVGFSGANKTYGGADEIYGGAEGEYIEDSGSGVAYRGTAPTTASALPPSMNAPGRKPR